MTIDPRWSIFLSLFLAICGVLAGSSGTLSDLGLDPKQAKAIIAIVTLFMGVGNAVNAVLAGIPSKDNKTGFILKGPDKPAGT